MPDKERPRVVFVGGFGRSGSTLLGRMLAETRGFVTVGELAQIWERGFTQNVRCGCGTAFRECAFWRDVVADAFGPDGLDAGEIARLRAVWSGRARPWFLAPWLGGRAYHAAFLSYVRRTEQLLAAVRRATGCRAVIDTSKTPLQLMAIASIPGVDVHVLHLIRDSRAVAHSWQRPRPRAVQTTEIEWHPTNPLKSAVLWSGTNVLLQLVARRYGRTLVRYEDLVANPAAELRRILTGLGDGSPPPGIDRGSVVLGVHHMVAGNPVRFDQGKIDLREDVEWKTEMSPMARRVVTAITWPLLSGYGYGGSFSSS